MKLIFATGNPGKLHEAREILGPSYEVLGPADLGLDWEIEETGNTFQENSLLKAKHIFNQCGLSCFADDSGLEVDVLDGAPGIHTARYASDHNFADNIAYLLFKLGSIFPLQEGCKSTSSRDLFPGAARFRCVITLILKDGTPHFFEGTVEGRIARQAYGEHGFGYDPVFVPDAFPDNTMAELSDEVKNSISHRGVALRALSDFLKDKRFP
ncbi:MAG: RdgB/HAM1 family non-canonical purine NTP pyrophosphatase [Rikenellaceae bacterium]|nr:RdgB/HAM1 family non-canonical purine NTP pyrophosphatase [Rikenellaceae bacterium]